MGKKLIVKYLGEHIVRTTQMRRVGLALLSTISGFWTQKLICSLVVDATDNLDFKYDVTTSIANGIWTVASWDDVSCCVFQAKGLLNTKGNVSFKLGYNTAKTTNNLSVKCSTLDGFESYEKAVLYDKETDTEYNLVLDAIYNFQVTNGINNNRFEIIFRSLK